MNTYPGYLIKKGNSGGEVLEAKNALLQLAMYTPNINAPLNNTFGSDTLAAVKKFQSLNGLAVDGIIGPLTWAALAAACSTDIPDIPNIPVTDEPQCDIPSHIGATARNLIAAALGTLPAGSKRTAVCLEALRHAYDQNGTTMNYPIRAYVWGGEYYNKNESLTEKHYTASDIDAAALKDPDKYDGGRVEFIKLAIAANGGKIMGADCNGHVNSSSRKAGVRKYNFDANANSLGGDTYSSDVQKAALLPGDYVWRSGHIGLYVGGGYVVEEIGVEYGCQLTMLDSRKAYSFMAKKIKTLSAWTKYRRPKCY